MKKIILSTLVMILCCSVYAEQLTSAGYLRKVSLHLRGSTPDMKDLVALSKMQPTEAQIFIEKKINEYLSSEEFNKRMQYHLVNLFRFNNGNFSSLRTSLEASEQNAADELFKSIIAGNKSWDDLLLAKEYVLYKNEASENTLYSKVFSEDVKNVGLPGLFGENYNSQNTSQNNEQKILKAETELQKNSIAGVLTTNRFLRRYGNTSVNKSRRRAAAVFRIFFCDDMRPVLTSGKEEDAELYAMATNTLAKDDSSHGSVEQLHANDPSCQACHYKLDPMAKTFRTTTEKLQTIGSPGSLVYKRKDGKTVDISVSGFGELAKAIVQQPEYRSCQVKNFWNWFIGLDAPMDESTAKNLEEKFDQLGRKPKDFVKHLIKLPIFSDFELFNKLEVGYNDVRPILQKCDKCHEDLYNFPSFAKYPMGENRSDHLKTLQFIDKSLDLAHNGKKAVMPPLEAGWNLSPVEINMLKKWIKSGAQFDEPESKLDVNEIQSLVSSWVQKENVSFPSFDQTYLRYQSYIQIEKSNTALNNSAGSNGQSCYLKAELWGRPMAESGRPNTLVPSPVTLQAYKSCVDTTSHLVYTKLSRSFDGKSLTQIISLVIDEVIGPQVLSKRSQNFLVKKLEAVAQSSTKAQAKIQSAGSTPQVENYSYITINAVIAAALTDYNYLVY